MTTVLTFSSAFVLLGICFATARRAFLSPSSSWIYYALATVAGLELREMAEAEVCCGFGGLFCVKYPDISNVMVTDKIRNAADTGAALVLAGDLGCLMNMAGKAKREGRAIEARHVVEVLAGDLATPAIGAGR